MARLFFFRIIINRKYVVGGTAQATPERAPARTVAIQEDSRRVELERYGGDLELNMNLLLRPGDAEEELKLKLDAQKFTLENRLCDLGYMALLSEGTQIMDGIIRSNPAFSSGAASMLHAKRIFRTQVYGCMNKNKFPVANLLMAAKYASAYSIGTQKGSVLILPHGVHEAITPNRKETTEFSVTGIKQGVQKSVSMELDEVYIDASTNVKIVIHHPTPTLENGSIRPNVSIESGGLLDESWVFTKHSYDGTNQYTQVRVPSLTKGKWTYFNVPPGKTLIRATKVVASSAILAAPGCGELLIAYPFCSVGTSPIEERIRLALRLYMGACIHQPDNVLIFPNVFIEGITAEAFFLYDEGSKAIYDAAGANRPITKTRQPAYDFGEGVDSERAREGAPAFEVRRVVDLGEGPEAHASWEGREAPASAHERRLGGREDDADTSDDEEDDGPKTALNAFFTDVRRDKDPLMDLAYGRFDIGGTPMDGKGDNDVVCMGGETGADSEFGLLDAPEHFGRLYGAPQAFSNEIVPPQSKLMGMDVF
jgi:hypothetical protein